MTRPGRCRRRTQQAFAFLKKWVGVKGLGFRFEGLVLRAYGFRDSGLRVGAYGFNLGYKNGESPE